MHQINLDDQVYEYAQRRAAELGCVDVQAYITLMLRQEQQAGENFDHLFTPERLAHIDQAAASIAEGRGLTSEEADAELARRRDEWLRQNG